MNREAIKDCALLAFVVLVGVPCMFFVLNFVYFFLLIGIPE